jgi:ankyrin repeat protein
MVLPETLQEVLRHNNLDAVEANLARSPATKRQEELNESLVIAMPNGNLDMIKLLLLLGAKLKEASFHRAVAREEAAVFQLLIEAGWDIDSTEYEMSAVQ